jgi:uncharacterized protein YvpB
MRHRKKISLGVFGFGLLTIGVGSAIALRGEKPPTKPVTDVILSRNASSGKSATSTSANATSSTPRSLRIDVPFTPQAPFANWDPPFDEACEEASLLMVHYYLTEQPLTREIAEQEIRNMVAWETEHVIPIDATIDQVAQIAEEYYGYETRILEGNEVTFHSMVKLLAEGHPIIIPAAGQLLGNPNFRGQGPPYHMLVLTGYDGTHFITNDPGTRRGESYRYDHDIILQSIHDWTGAKETILKGARKILVLEPKEF